MKTQEKNILVKLEYTETKLKSGLVAPLDDESFYGVVTIGNNNYKNGSKIFFNKDKAIKVSSRTLNMFNKKIDINGEYYIINIENILMEF